MNKKNLIFLLIILILSILFYLNKNLFLAKLDNSTVVDSSVVGIVGEKTEHYDDNFVLINEKTVEEKNKEKRLSFMDFVFICEKVDKDYGSFSTENINCDVYYKDSFLKTFENVLIYYNKDFRMISFYENGLGGSFLNTRYIINGNDELVEMPGIIPQHGSAISYAYDINKNFIVVYKISDFNSEFVSYDIYNKEGELIPEDYLNCYFAYLDDQVVNFSANCKYRDVVINHSKRKNFGETVESKNQKESFESSLIIPQENSIMDVSSKDNFRIVAGENEIVFKDKNLFIEKEGERILLLEDDLDDLNSFYRLYLTNDLNFFVYSHCGGAGFGGVCNNYYFDIESKEIKLKIKDLHYLEGNNITFGRDGEDNFLLEPFFVNEKGDTYERFKDDQGCLTGVLINDNFVSLSVEPIEFNASKEDIYSTNIFYSLTFIGAERDFSKAYFNFLVKKDDGSQLFNEDLSYSFEDGNAEFID